MRIWNERVCVCVCFPRAAINEFKWHLVEHIFHIHNSKQQRNVTVIFRMDQKEEERNESHKTVASVSVRVCASKLSSYI